jgi:hypothetical protein
MVTLAEAGPFTRSDSLVGGIGDSAVGSGMVDSVFTLQPESIVVSAGKDRTTVGVGRAFVVGVRVGVACA